MQDYDKSMFLKHERLFIVASPAEIHLYDAVTLERYQIYTAANLKNTDIMTLMKEDLLGLEPVVGILYHSLELLQLKLVKVLHYDQDTSELKPR